MQPLTSSPEQVTPGPQSTRGRWIWVVSGTVTIAFIGALGGFSIVRAENAPPGPPPITSLPTRTVTVSQPVTALNVQSYGSPIKVIVVPGGPVQVSETITYNQDEGVPAVTADDAHGLLSLAAPACANFDCSVGFSVTVPARVPVTAVADGGSVAVAGTGTTSIDSGGGPVYASDIGGPLTVSAEGDSVTVDKVSGTASVESGGGPVTASAIGGKLTVHADGGEITAAGAPAALLDSGGGPVYASAISGPLTVSAEGGGVAVSQSAATVIDSGGGPVTATTINGPLRVTAEGGGVQANNVIGALSVDTGSGPITATGLSASSATVNAEGGSVTLGFLTPPTSVSVDSGGGDASLSVPGGPYALSVDSGGSTESVSIPNNPGAARSITVSTQGGNLEIAPA